MYANSEQIGSWNIRRGIVKREIEIVQLLKDEELDILFLTETDVFFVLRKLFHCKSSLQLRNVRCLNNVRFVS